VEDPEGEGGGGVERIINSSAEGETLTAGSRAARSVAIWAPLVLPFLPKCPLCVLPLAAVLGVALPPGPLLDALVAAGVAAWLAAVIPTSRSFTVMAFAAAAAVFLLGGRFLGLPWAGWIGCASMLAIAGARRRASWQRAPRDHCKAAEGA
jgi:hypothetical protein